MTSKTEIIEVKIDEIAEKLPIDEWFTKVQFAEFTGIKIKSCTMRLNKIIKKGMLIVDRSHKKAYYMMTEKCWRKMIEQSAINENVKAESLSLGRKKKEIKQSQFDKLLFSTRII